MKKFFQEKLKKFRKKKDADTTAISTRVKGKKKKKITKKRVIIAICILVVGVVVYFNFFAPKEDMEVLSQGIDEIVSKQTIQSSISSNATLKPANQYSIASSVKGDVLECFFEKGDILKEGDIMYKIDSSDTENTIERAEISYKKVYKNYLDTMKILDDLNIKPNGSGTITKLYVKVGDDVFPGDKIADVRNSDVMVLTVPFNANDAKNIKVGDTGTVTVNSTFEKFNCTVTEVDGADTILSGNRIVRYVEVEVNNPGAISDTTEGTVIINNMACSASSKFKYSEEFTITSKVNGTISTLNVLQGSKIQKNNVIGTIKSDSVADQVESAKLSLDDAKLSYDNTLSQLDDYTIKAPITGTVITKNTKAGDKLDTTNGQNTLAVIYDMSYLSFDISIDELDINKIKVGQSVIVTSDAIVGMFEGIVTKVSVAGTTENRVTTYPVTVQIDNPPEGLLPGMNINAQIVLEKAEDVLAVPINAVQMGNVVYIKDSSITTSPNPDMGIPVGYREAMVETGVSDNYYTQIISGLSEGDVIYVPQSMRGNGGGGFYMGGMGGGHTTGDAVYMEKGPGGDF